LNALLLLDYAAVLVFAVTGALVASRAQLDIIGFGFVACLTAVGGGSVRDLLLDRNPVFWIADPAILGVALGAAVVIFFTAHWVESRLKAVIWLDAVALSVAVAAGVLAARETGQPAVVQAIMGLITGCMGGLMRDVVCNEVPLVLKQGELYVTAALAGAVGMITVLEVGAERVVAVIVCAAVVFCLRAGSMVFGWRLPVYRARPPRQ
jgi:uncharacterized membrane protein YeiH